MKWFQAEGTRQEGRRVESSISCGIMESVLESESTDQGSTWPGVVRITDDGYKAPVCSAWHIVNAVIRSHFHWLLAVAPEGSGLQPAVGTLLPESPSYYQAQSVFWLFKINGLGRLCLRTWMKVE